ncbi:hypothetical protein FOB64_006076 [Candida albicans]|uniref:Uncharacterized protein n=1 Tax=Candida albicans TaxID=5476 RepID=A0A8H6BRJ1_CANAX|nr:hypothetical protein FOB64_006076 [Candida albicans]
MDGVERQIGINYLAHFHLLTLLGPSLRVQPPDRIAEQGTQSFYFALFAPIFMKIEGGNVVQECKIMTKVRKEYTDDDLQQKVFHNTEELIKQIETKSAIERKKHENAKKTPEQKAKERQEELNRKRDLHIKPETPEELESKLNSLRNQIGMGTGISSNEMPLFPDDETLKKVISSKKNASSNNRDGSKSNKSQKKSKKV